MSRETYSHMVPTPSRDSMNSNLSAAKVTTLKSVFGAFPNLPENCGAVKNDKVRALTVTRSVGPFRVTGIIPAVESLTRIFAAIKRSHPDLYSMIASEGMMCYRHVRGIPGVPSNHAAGTAIDLTVGGVLPEFNATMIPNGFVVMYGYFHAEKWYWGAGYNGRTDPMHFECSDQLLKLWDAQGEI